MRKTVVYLGILAILLLVARPVRAAGDEEGKLNAFFAKFLDESFRRRPLDATRLGDHRFDHLLDDLTPKARAGWLDFLRDTLKKLPGAVDYRKLARSAQIDYEIFKHHLVSNIWQAENTRPFEEDPRAYNDYIGDGIFLVLTQSTAGKADQLRSCVVRMALIPRVVAAARKNLDRPAKVYVATAIRQNKGAIAFFESGIYDLSRETPQVSALAPAARRVVEVLKKYQVFLENDLLKRGTGEWRLGKERFARKLDLELDAGISAGQVFKDAEEDFARVERDMYVIARQLWASTFPRSPLPPDDPAGRRTAIRRVLAHFNRDHGTVGDLVRDARATVDRIRAFIKEKDILRLPEPDRCRVVEMPEFQRGFSVAYLNPAPPLDPKAESFYAVSPPPRSWDARRVGSFMEEYNRYMLQILTIHEAFPGHYVQLDYSNRHPSSIRKVLSSGVFAEGWAVYTEQMMLDEGYGKGDLVLRLNQLKWYLRTVANAILDHKMHCANMSDAEALTFLTQGAYQSEGEALGKIVRAKLSSCQLSTYFVGRMAFYRLRQKLQRERGAKFVLGRYHEEVLSHGTLPVKYLPELVGGRE